MSFILNDSNIGGSQIWKKRVYKALFIRGIMKSEPEIVELSEFLSEFNKESDRGAALNAAAVLDDWLGNILREFFADR